mmetsp:Transcript_9727/g.13750  ORF Transcript_9727/g.13750 Transcript_9727/m.13750 type:complete len:689 (-) Transcript_9727:785-2851(-)
MADAARAARAAALEEKKRRLEELKARRLKRSENQGGSVRRPTSAGNLDEYIDNLLQKSALSGTSTAAAEKRAAAASAQPTGAAASVENGVAATPATADGTAATVTTSTTATSTGDDGSATNNVIAVSVPAAAAPPVKVVETFTISTQTDKDDFPPELESEDEDDDEASKGSKDKDGEKKKKSDTEGSRETPDDTKEATIEAKLLSAEEMEAEIASKPFSTFLNTASKKVERMLGTPVLADLLVNYVGEGDDDVDSEREKASDGSRFVSAHQIFECAKWTATRDVTDMDWSPLHRELMLTSYHMPGGSLGGFGSALSAISPDDTPSSSLAPRSGELQSDGLALVWNLAMPARPEHIFTCGSPVLSARFHPTEAPLVVGACHSGQLVIWDVRAGRLPVQRSSLTTVASATKGHAHPICSMEIVEGGSGLVTAATDGKVNFWSLANLRDAAESLQVKGNISCLAVAPESNTLICGDECGTIHTIQPSPTAAGGGSSGAPRASRRPIRTLDTGDDMNNVGHFGMVTSIATKTLNKKDAGRVGLFKGFLRGSGGLVLTSGIDWTTKLWAPAYTDKPLLSLVSHSYDYMCDVQWSPTHPALFATASSNGTMGLWNLASSLDEPISGSEGIVVEPDATSGRGLNKLKWSSDGRRILVASADRVHVLSMSEEATRKKGDEETKLMHQLTSRGLLNP